MIDLCRLIGFAFVELFRSHASLEAEILALPAAFLRNVSSRNSATACFSSPACSSRTVHLALRLEWRGQSG